MNNLDVRIVKLEPMRVASVRAIGEIPERHAWEKMCAWAEPEGLFEELQQHPVFGFNNPNPSAGHKQYGYEFWIRIDPDADPQGDVEVKDFPGGLYAVTTCKLQGDPNVLETWKMLWEWVQSSKYEWRRTHELEKPRDPLASEQDLVLDLYLPIKE